MTGDARDDRRAIRELKHRYCYHLDAREADAFVELFAEDATFDVPGHSGEGWADLRAFVEDLASGDIERLTHTAANPIVEVDGDRATGRWYYTVVVEREGGTVEWGQGEWDDAYRRVDGEWRIASVVATRRHTLELA